MKRRYAYYRRSDGKTHLWLIVDCGPDCDRDVLTAPVVWSMPWLDEHNGLDEPPLELRQKYEALLTESGFRIEEEAEHPNLVEMVADSDECAWDQPCAHGHRVGGHAVYCHNSRWLYAPTKCHRNATDWPHAKCPGFLANPHLGSTQ